MVQPRFFPRCIRWFPWAAIMPCQRVHTSSQALQTPIQISKIWSKVPGAIRLRSKAVTGILKFTHSGTPGRDKFMTSKPWDLSQLNGTPSHQRAKGIRCAASNSLLALRHPFWAWGPKPSRWLAYEGLLPSLQMYKAIHEAKSIATHSFWIVFFLWLPKIY